jgi:molecular chaperone DnaK
VNPDEVVAIGAAVQAGVLSGDVKDMVLLDVTPLSLGVETLGGVMTTLIERNTTIPTRREEVFSTAEDNQNKVEIHVLQGERAEARLNRTLGRFHLEGIMASPRGVPKIKVTFDIDANGILSVTARDEATGKDQKITITANSGLSESEIQKMVEEAKKHEEEDKIRREEVEQRNRADQLCYQVEKTLDETKDKLPAEKTVAIREQIAKLRGAIEKQDKDGIKTGTETLEKLMHEIAQAAYQAAGTPPAGDAPGGASGASGAEGGGKPGAGSADQGKKKQDDVIDAEYEEGN